MKNLFLAFLLLILAGIAFGWSYLRAIFFTGVPDVIPTEYVHIPSNSSFDEVVATLQNGGYINNVEDFTWLAEQMKYRRDKMRSGRFKIKAGWTNRDLLLHLRGGEQEPVKVVLNNAWLTNEVAGKVAQVLEADSVEIARVFNDKNILAKYNRTPENLMAMIIPNTYEFFWNTDAEGFLKRMQKEHKAFWDAKNRRSKATRLNLDPDKAYTVASIVERESNHNPEKPRIAGVYLNRFDKGMRLQADPTCKFATGDLKAKRVTFYHTTFDSPFNTYVYKGLPPGPISMASIPSIDAVLNREDHEYIYFCAKPDASGQHAFAKTLAGHGVNVAKFRVYQRNVLGQR